MYGGRIRNVWQEKDRALPRLDRNRFSRPISGFATISGTISTLPIKNFSSCFFFLSDIHW